MLKISSPSIHDKNMPTVKVKWKKVCKLNSKWCNRDYYYLKGLTFKFQLKNRVEGIIKLCLMLT